MNRRRRERRQGRGHLARCAAAIALILVCTAAGQEPQPAGKQSPQERQPPTFRSGTNTIRVDATVTDTRGAPITSLTPDDFEIKEDGRVQPITSFKFISVNGQPGDDRSLPIRSQSHAAVEASREDVRTFLVFWDEYHIQPFVSALRGREGLTRAVLDSFGPTDLVAIMDPLTPLSAIEFTRDRRMLADRIHTLEGRRGVYLPPRSAAEEEQLNQVNWRAERVEVFRTQVTVSAIKAAAAHLGTLGPARKTLILLTEGFGGIRPERGGVIAPISFSPAIAAQRDGQDLAIDIVRAANDSNTAIQVIDPRGLQVGRPVFGGLLDTIASGTGGDLHQTNDMREAFGRIVQQVSALYLLGYTRDIPVDGRFHQIRVRVKRAGVEVRARTGYWAPRLQDVEHARKAAAAAVLPAPLAAAFAALPPANSPASADVWSGMRPLPNGRIQLTLAWMPRSGTSGDTKAASVTATIDPVDTDPFDVHAEAGGTTVETAAGTIQLAIRVRNAAGEIIDRETTRFEAFDGEHAALALATPRLHRARTPAELRAILASTDAPVHAGREFVRTDRLIVRTSVHGTAAKSASVAARLLDRHGASLVTLPVQRTPDGAGHQIDLPLTSIAAGEFALAIDARAGEDHAEAFVPLRVVR